MSREREPDDAANGVPTPNGRDMTAVVPFMSARKTAPFNWIIGAAVIALVGVFGLALMLS